MRRQWQTYTDRQTQRQADIERRGRGGGRHTNRDRRGNQTDTERESERLFVCVMKTQKLKARERTSRGGGFCCTVSGDVCANILRGPIPRH